MTAGERAAAQYGSGTGNLDRRVAIHAFGTNPQSWADFVRARLPFARGQRVLDVGAGTGVHWSTIPAGTQPVLTDLHAPMCAALTGLGTAVARCSAEQLPFAQESFDGVMSLHVLYHVPSPPQAVAELVRVLRCGGWVALASNGPAHLRELDEVAAAVGMARDRPHHARFSIDDAERLLIEQGLSPVVIRYPDELRLTESGPALDYLDSLGEPLVDGVRAAAAARVDDVIRAQGAFRIGKQTGLVLATKQR